MKNLKCIEVNGEGVSVRNAFTSVLKQAGNLVFNYNDAIRLLEKENLEIAISYDDVGGFSLISNFGSKKGCLLKAVPIIFENEEIGGLILEKENCRIISKEQLYCYKKINEQQTATFTFRI